MTTDEQGGPPLSPAAALLKLAHPNQWLRDRLKEGKTLECGCNDCYLCAYFVLQQAVIDMLRQGKELKDLQTTLALITPTVREHEYLPLPSSIFSKRSISDDDLCSDCAFCDYNAGETSGCDEDFVNAVFNPDDYVVKCVSFVKEKTK